MPQDQAGGRAITSIAEKIGCAAETLQNWVLQAERDRGRRPGLRTHERARFKQFERENVDLRCANKTWGWRRRISRRRSSTVEPSDGRVHRDEAL